MTGRRWPSGSVVPFLFPNSRARQRRRRRRTFDVTIASGESRHLLAPPSAILPTPAAQ